MDLGEILYRQQSLQLQSKYRLGFRVNSNYDFEVLCITRVLDNSVPFDVLLLKSITYSGIKEVEKLISKDHLNKRLSKKDAEILIQPETVESGIQIEYDRFLNDG